MYHIFGGKIVTFWKTNWRFLSWKISFDLIASSFNNCIKQWSVIFLFNIRVSVTNSIYFLFSQITIHKEYLGFDCILIDCNITKIMSLILFKLFLLNWLLWSFLFNYLLNQRSYYILLVRHLLRYLNLIHSFTLSLLTFVLFCINIFKGFIYNLFLITMKYNSNFFDFRYFLQ